MQVCRNTVELIRRAINTSQVSNAHINVIANAHSWELVHHLLQKTQLSNWFDEVELVFTLKDIVDEFEVDVPSDVGATTDEHSMSGLSDKIVARFVEYFSGYPYRCYTFFPIPRLGLLSQAELTINDQVSLIDTRHVSDATQLEKIGSWRSLTPGPRRLLEKVVYVRVLSHGHPSRKLESAAVSKSFALLKYMLVLAEWTGLFEHRGLGAILAGTPSLGPLWEDMPAIVSLADNMIPVNGLPVPLPAPVFERLSWYKVLSKWNHHENLVQLQETAVQDHLRNMLSIADFSDDDPDVRPIRTSIEWFFDAMTTQNESVAFIQRCIGLEAVLGDKTTKDRITDKLSDRYAYLIGDTVSARKELKEKFIKVYNERSEIVHGRDMRLKMGSESKDTIEKMLRSVIEKELALLLRARRYPDLPSMQH